jgi:protein TonB
MDSEAVRAETRVDAVEHNGEMDLQAAGSSAIQSDAKGSAAHMANDLLLQSDSETEAAVALSNGHELDAFLGKAFEEPPIWKTLYDNVCDLFFPRKLPPLELTSKPIPVPDRMAVKPNPWAIGISTAVNLSILAVLLFFVGKKIIEAVKPPLTATPIDVGTFQLKAPKVGNEAGGGGGGGSHDIVNPIKGKLPQIEQKPMVPPQVPVLDKPKIPIESAIAVQKNITLPDNPTLPNIGVTQSPNVTLASNGQGGGAGMGTGYGGGLGSGNGNGFGPGSGGNTGGGLYRIGGGVSAPVPIYQPEAEFSDEARRAKYQGVCIVSLIVDAQGNPQNVHVVRPLGMGLDEKALEAVRKYKFKPAMKDGRTPVPVMISIEVNFRLY